MSHMDPATLLLGVVGVRPGLVQITAFSGRLLATEEDSDSELCVDESSLAALLVLVRLAGTFFSVDRGRAEPFFWWCGGQARVGSGGSVRVRSS